MSHRLAVLLVLSASCGGTVNGSTQDVTPVDECATGTATCDPMATCEDRAVGYACICPVGYEEVERRCERLREAGLVIRGVELLEGSGTLPQTDHTLIAVNDRIAWVGPDTDAVVYDDDDVLDGSGLFAIPGVINAHVHQSFSESNLERWAAAGVTTVRDVGASLAAPAEWPVGYWDAWAAEIFAGDATLADRIPPAVVFRDAQESVAETARLRLSGPCLTAPDSYPAGNSLAFHVEIEPFMEGGQMITPEEDAYRKAALLAEAGVDHIKICLENNWGTRTEWDVLSQSQISEIGRAASDFGIYTVAHTSAAEQLDKSVYAEFPISDAVHIPTDEVSESTMSDMIDMGIIIVPTLEVWHNQPAICTDFGKCEDPRNLDVFVEMGGRVAVGDDYGNSGIALGMPVDEMELMQQAGLTNLEILTAATLGSAIALALDDQLGTLEPGKIADVVLLNSDPLIDITNAADVHSVIKDGVVISGSFR